MNEDNIKKETNDIQKSFLDKVIIILVVLSCIFVVYKSIEHIFISKYDPIVPRKYQKEVYNLNKGEWIIVEDEMSEYRPSTSYHLLPDGNVLLMGTWGNHNDVVDIFDTTLMKIIKRIPLKNNRCTGYNSTTLKNGDVFISGGNNCFIDNNNKIHFEKAMTAEIFNSKTYQFSNAKNLDISKQFYNSLLLENGHVLIFPSSEKKTDTHLIYNPEKNEYYKADSDTKPHGSKFFKLENGDVIIFNPSSFMYKTDKKNFIYRLKENKFETYEYLPMKSIMIQLDNERYLTIGFTSKESIGAVYDIKTKKLTSVKNKINQTWKPSTIEPSLTLLKNGNVLILGIKSKSFSRKDVKYDRYSAYIYDTQKNIFYEIPSTPYPILCRSSIMLNNGDILFAGGRKERGYGSREMLIYRY